MGPTAVSMANNPPLLGNGSPTMRSMYPPLLGSSRQTIVQGSPTMRSMFPPLVGLKSFLRCKKLIWIYIDSINIIIIRGNYKKVEI